MTGRSPVPAGAAHRYRSGGSVPLARLRAAGDRRAAVQHLRARHSARAVIPTILAQLHSGAREIRLGSLTPTRDFTYVTDIAAGFLALAGCDRALGTRVNLGTGRDISIGDLAQALVTASGRDAEIVVDPARLGPSRSEVHRLLSDNTRARRACADGGRSTVP